MTLKQTQAKCGDQAQLSLFNHDTSQSDELTQDISNETFVHVASISNVGAMVAAEELCLVTTFGLGVFHSHPICVKEAQRAPLYSNQIGYRFAQDWLQSCNKGICPTDEYIQGTSDIYSNKLGGKVNRSINP